MKELVLLIAVIAFVVFGYFLMKRLDLFLEENRKCLAEEEKKDETIGILSFQIADGSNVSKDNMKDLSEMYPSVEFTLKNKKLNIVCKRENTEEIESFIGNFFACYATIDLLQKRRKTTSNML